MFFYQTKRLHAKLQLIWASTIGDKCLYMLLMFNIFILFQFLTRECSEHYEQVTAVMLGVKGTSITPWIPQYFVSLFSDGLGTSCLLQIIVCCFHLDKSFPIHTQQQTS